MIGRCKMTKASNFCLQCICDVHKAAVSGRSSFPKNKDQRLPSTVQLPQFTEAMTQCMSLVKSLVFAMLTNSEERNAAFRELFFSN